MVSYNLCNSLSIDKKSHLVCTILSFVKETVASVLLFYLVTFGLLFSNQVETIRKHFTENDIEGFT